MTTTLGEPYTVTEYGLRQPDGTVESLGTDDQFRFGRAALRFPAVMAGRAAPVSRQVTGRDEFFDDGLPVPGLKARYAAHPGVPQHVDSATEWAESQ
jgi:hypothetical protein